MQTSKWACHASLAVLAAALSWPAAGQSACIDDAAQQAATKLLPLEVRDGAAALSAAPGPEWATLARQAIAASADSRSAESTRQASLMDLAQTRAASKPRVTTSATVSTSDYRSSFRDYGSRGTGVVGLTMEAPLFDGGRLEALVRQREQLADASASGMHAARERAVREAVLMQLERERRKAQLQVWQWHVDRLACLSSMVDKIAELDRGRTSELVQARQSLLQAEAARDDARTAMEFAESQLQRMLRGTVPESPGASRVLWTPPPIEGVLQQVEQNADVRQLRQQADALAQAALAAEAERLPQVKWSANYNNRREADRNDNRLWQFGLVLSHTLFDAGALKSAESAARERARAATAAWEHALAERGREAAGHHQSAERAYRRAAQFGNLMQDSEALRKATYVQWASLGRRSLFDLMSAERQYLDINLSYINAMYDGFSSVAHLRNLGGGLVPWLAPDLASTPTVVVPEVQVAPQLPDPATGP